MLAEIDPYHILASVHIYWTTLSAIVPVFFLMGMGMILRRLEWFKPAADESLMRMVIYLFYPALILYYTVGNPALNHVPTLLMAPALGFITVVLGFAIAWKVAGLLGLSIGKGQRSFAFSCGVFNYGYIPVPLVAILFASRETTGVLFVFNIGVEIAMWTLGILLLTGGGLGQIWKKLANPPMLALFFALCLNFSGVGTQIPSVVMQTLAMISACAIPLGLVLSGATLGDLLREGALRGKTVLSIVAVALRLLLLPLIFILAARYLPGVSDEIRMVLVIQSAMPAALFSIVMAKHYGGDAGVAVSVVLATTSVALLTIPLWIHWGMAFVFG